MDRLKAIKLIRKKLRNNACSIGSWMQIPNSSIAEIMGQSGYDWVAVDMEHGAISQQERRGNLRGNTHTSLKK